MSDEYIALGDAPIRRKVSRVALAKARALLAWEHHDTTSPQSRSTVEEYNDAIMHLGCVVLWAHLDDLSG